MDVFDISSKKLQNQFQIEVCPQALLVWLPLNIIQVYFTTSDSGFA